MIYFSRKFKQDGGFSCHVGAKDIRRQFDVNAVEYAQADGHELEQACEILGRSLPPNRVYTFCGDNAREIFMNWR